MTLFGSPFLTWRGLPLVPSDKVPFDEAGKAKILLLRTGEKKQGVVGLFQPGVPARSRPASRCASWASTARLSPPT